MTLIRARSPQFENLSKAILQAGMERYGAMLGIVSAISEGSYEVVSVCSDTGIPAAGDVYDLDAVYCREVFQKQKTVAITEIDGEPGMRLHPLYDLFPCEFYISAPVVIRGSVWGTINFTSFEKRSTPFSEEDVRFIETLAGRVAEIETQTSVS